MPRKPPAYSEWVGRRFLASMRPRQKCPGNGHRRGVVDGAGDASMRPRQKCPGNSIAPSRFRGSPRRFNEAEAEMPRKQRCGRRAALPRGPRFNEAEAEMPRKPCPTTEEDVTASRSFNEAEAEMPRKLIREALAAAPQGELQ